MNRIKTLVMALVAAGALSLPVAAQEAAAPPPARPEDVASVDAILKALYDVISGPAGQKRDWARFHSLFIPGARLIPTGKAQDGSIRHRVQTPQQYQESSGRMLEERGFFEVEINRVTETYGNITHAFSTYESRALATDEKPFARGINSIQLLNDGKRWHIVSIFWDGERSDNPLPAKYLPKR
jgi:hypothetical protein